MANVAMQGPLAEGSKRPSKPLVMALLLAIIVLIAFAADLIYFATRYQTLYDRMHPEQFSGLDVSDAYMGCPRTLKPEFERRKVEGLEKMKSMRVVFCSLCRNVEPNLPLFMERIELAGRYFADYHVIVFENDSRDMTREILVRWTETNPRVDLMACNPDVPAEQDCKLRIEEMYTIGAIHPTRFSKMAHFRNSYLKRVQTSYSDWDICIVIDSDLKGPFSVGGLATCFTYGDDWDCYAALGLFVLPGTSFAGGWRVAYDALAFVPEGDDRDRTGWTRIDYYKFFLSSLRLASKHQVGSPPLRVKSAFNGMAVYKISSLKGLKYEPDTCEHVGLHRVMRENGRDRIFINPSLLVFAGSQGPPLGVSWTGNGGSAASVTT